MMVLRFGFALAAMGASTLNGAPSSPLFDPVLYLLRPALAPLPVDPEVLFYLSSVFIALLTLAIAGIPAAIWERVRGLTQSSWGSMLIWMLAAVVVSLPGILGVLGYYEIE